MTETHVLATKAWARLMALAAEQYGVFTTEDAAACGVSREMLRKQRERGIVQRLFQGVYGVCGSPDTVRQRFYAAQAFCGGIAVLSHTSAGWLHGLQGVEPNGVELLMPRGEEHELVAAVLHTSKTFTDEDVTMVGDFRVTSIERTIVDLAGLLSLGLLRRVVFDAWRRGLTRPLDIARCLARVGRVNGARRLKRVLGECIPGLDRAYSLVEVDALRALERDGLPLATLNIDVPVCDGAKRRKVDIGYPTLRLGWEIDSQRHHSIAPDVADDQDKDGELAAVGWAIERVDANLIHFVPEEFARMVRAALTEAGHPELLADGHDDEAPS